MAIVKAQLSKSQIQNLDGRSFRIKNKDYKTKYAKKNFSADSCLYSIIEKYCRINNYNANLKPYSNGLIIDLELVTEIGLTPAVVYAALIRHARTCFGDDFKGRDFLYTIEHGFKDLHMDRRQQETRIKTLIDTGKIFIAYKNIPGTNVKRARYITIL